MAVSDARHSNQKRCLIVEYDRLAGRMYEFVLTESLDLQVDTVHTIKMAIDKLLRKEYDLILLGGQFPEVRYSALPDDIAAAYRAIRKEPRLVGGVDCYPEGERLFRLLRSPDVAESGWVTDVRSVPVIFLTSNPESLNPSIIRSMPPVAIFREPASLEELESQIRIMLGWTEDSTDCK